MTRPGDRGNNCCNSYKPTIAGQTWTKFSKPWEPPLPRFTRRRKTYHTGVIITGLPRWSLTWWPGCIRCLRGTEPSMQHGLRWRKRWLAACHPHHLRNLKHKDSQCQCGRRKPKHNLCQYGCRYTHSHSHSKSNSNNHSQCRRPGRQLSSGFMASQTNIKYI